MDYDRIAEAIRATTPWKVGYPIIGECIREYLDANPHLSLSTQELCEVLLPLRVVCGDALTARARLLEKLGSGAIAKHVAQGYAAQSVLTKNVCGRQGRGWIWSAPSVKPAQAILGPKTKGEGGQHCCPSCGFTFLEI